MFRTIDSILYDLAAIIPLTIGFAVAVVLAMWDGDDERAW